LTSAEPPDAAPDNMPAGSIGAMQSSKGDMLPAITEDERSTPLVADPAERRLESFDIDRIQVGRRTRALNTERLEALVQSISTIGLRSPIAVRIVPKMMVDGVEEEDVPVLVAGLHRLEAVKKLGRKLIDCFVERGSELDSQLWEIDENLCRAELTELERGEHLQRRKAIYEQMCPETRQGGLPGAPGGGKAKTANLAGFGTDTAAKTGISERTIRRDIRRASEIDHAVRDRIRENREIADSGVELDTLAGMAATGQNRAVDMVEAGQAASVREAKKLLEGQVQAEEPDAEAPELVDIRPKTAPSDERRQGPLVQPQQEGNFAWETGARQLIPLLVSAVLRLEEVPDEAKIRDLLKYCHYDALADQLSKRPKRATETDQCSEAGMKPASPNNAIAAITATEPGVACAP
jgi:hypothetical protein